MHYPFADGRGCGPSRGCLRVVAGSHRWGPERDAEFQEELQRRRVEAGLPATFSPLTASQPGADGRVDDMVEPTMPGEVTIALGPADLLVRRGSIYHCAHANSEDEGRLMQHWLFRAHDHFPNSAPRPAPHAPPTDAVQRTRTASLTDRSAQTTGCAGTTCSQTTCSAASAKRSEKSSGLGAGRSSTPVSSRSGRGSAARSAGAWSRSARSSRRLTLCR